MADDNFVAPSGAAHAAAPRLPRATRVRNKQPADQQITAEQILREAQELRDVAVPRPQQTVADRAELDDYRRKRRKEFEDAVRRVRWQQGAWTKYANWEEAQGDLRRARSVWERALEVDATSAQTWQRYAEMEMRAGAVAHARNVWDRATALLPRVDSLWFKYVAMEQVLGNVEGARSIFERWATWQPGHEVWRAFVNFEDRAASANAAAAAAAPAALTSSSSSPSSRPFSKSGDPTLTRAVYERYVSALPTVDAYIAWAKWEMRSGRVAEARSVYERAVEALCARGDDENGKAGRQQHQQEEERPSDGVIVVYEDDAPGGSKAGGVASSSSSSSKSSATNASRLYLAFAAFEALAGEPERARAIYRHALDSAPKRDVAEVFEAYSAFERSRGDREGVDAVVAAERRLEYESRVETDRRDYDAWFEYARLEEGAAAAELAAMREEAELGSNAREEFDLAQASSSSPAVARVREVYERAVAALPPALPPPNSSSTSSTTAPPSSSSSSSSSETEKRLWKRYIYLWIYYAVFEELVAGDSARAAAVYKAALGVVPHARFTFAKLWVLAARCHVRRKDLASARRLLGQALGRCPRRRVFDAYVDLEMALGEVDRARTLRSKLVEWCPESASAWAGFAALEESLGETARARAVLELAVGQPALDAPELLWKRFIDFEISRRKRRRARDLYERLLERTGHVKVWLSYAAFEEAPLPEKSEDGDESDDESDDDDDGDGDGNGEGIDLDSPDDESQPARESRARAVFERAFRSLRDESPELKEEAVAVLEAWRAFEKRCAAAAAAAAAASPSSDAAVSSSAKEEAEERRARVEAKFPRRIKRKRPAQDQSLGVMEEYYDYIFPGEGGSGIGGAGGGGGGGEGVGGGGAAAPSLKLLEAAQAWKRAKLAQEAAAAAAANAGGEDDD